MTKDELSFLTIIREFISWPSCRGVGNIVRDDIVKWIDERTGIVFDKSPAWYDALRNAEVQAGKANR